ncbi:MAG: TetR/AcrR family transcriptional regulator, tetracycline repressor protein [Pseudonocardiales bacterium]|nr:TetR/AcrR family transcriptional regulator, tetracycline repressor protein [Pseudonocardiales bacterium]
MGAKVAVRADLSRDAIVDRSLTIADAEGIAAITIRRVAQEFGVTPMALYWHVKNKDELLDAMGDRFFEHLDPVPTDGDWADQLRAAVASLVVALRRHPGAAHLAAARVMHCAAGRDLAERTLGLLRAEGFTVAQAADIARNAMQTAVMLVTNEAGAEPHAAAELRQGLLETKRNALKALPIDRYPHLVEAADAMTDCEDVDGYYEFGVDMFVAGARATLAAAKA